jgi:hypothetical protein
MQLPPLACCPQMQSQRKNIEISWTKHQLFLKGILTVWNFIHHQQSLAWRWLTSAKMRGNCQRVGRQWQATPCCFRRKKGRAGLRPQPIRQRGLETGIWEWDLVVVGCFLILLGTPIMHLAYTELLAYNTRTAQHLSWLFPTLFKIVVGEWINCAWQIQGLDAFKQ